MRRFAPTEQAELHPKAPSKREGDGTGQRLPPADLLCSVSKRSVSKRRCFSVPNRLCFRPTPLRQTTSHLPPAYAHVASHPPVFPVRPSFPFASLGLSHPGQHGRNSNSADDPTHSRWASPRRFRGVRPSDGQKRLAIARLAASQQPRPANYRQRQSVPIWRLSPVGKPRRSPGDTLNTVRSACKKIAGVFRLREPWWLRNLPPRAHKPTASATANRATAPACTSG